MRLQLVPAAVDSDGSKSYWVGKAVLPLTMPKELQP